ncbi:amidohydrolase family protein [Lactobacillus helveticus]|uniref:Adenine deaminase n=1 Tax=Lactobacillus delbrueckii subsp. bulgaricus TaxID=1585 RepID=A0AAV5PG01_LACDE|nr:MULTISPECIES: adenine deaminase C-terminal domain-containing protein [Lactobacillus]ADY85086.1 Adenine deaminase 1 [Lactobacillus delbrueckii subsp. bulgaricus 2038]ANZ55242.1 adenosine deaminase [Lactobacillus helveticus]AQY53348.1 adenosine deaminase [Lactobacillus helveticus]AXI15024.1 Adenine deaminase 1 [Lactobacillus delbrueckii subsp. bulgaricus]MBT8816762.1 adenosine deaminase [Lactobacillus delbrueckii subsp. bulgaricus]
MLTKELLSEYIDAGAAKIKADLAIMGGTLINVNTGEYYLADVAIYKGRIVAVDQDISDYLDDHTQIVDAKGKYLAPGLIDCHIHVECSKMSMTRFAQAVVPHGTTSIITGFDEYISVVGVDGLKEIFEEVDHSPLKVFWGLPYKTPYTIPKSTIAYDVTSQDHEKYQNSPRCWGVWETVREAVQTKDPTTMAALVLARNNHQAIFGCSPMAHGKEINEFLMSGVRVDHESYDHKEFMEKARKGVHVVIRESAVTKFLKENIKAITEGAAGIARHTSFCSDDVNARGILAHGHLDHMVRLAIAAGVSPMTAIQMATINGAEACKIDDYVGSIAPGKDADILLVDQPGKFNVESVISKGKLVTLNGKNKFDYQVPERSEALMHTVKHPLMKADDFKYHVAIQNGSAQVETINSIGPFVRKRRDVTLNVANGVVEPSTEKDVALVSVVERYGINGNHAQGFISGWNFQKGAIATTAAPDDNNLVVAGVNYDDMALAANTLIERGGGQVVVIDGQVVAYLALPVAGIASDLTPEELAQKEQELEQSAQQIGSKLPDPIFYLSFLPITAIPDLAITDGGNVDYTKLRYFDPILSLKEK